MQSLSQRYNGNSLCHTHPSFPHYSVILTTLSSFIIEFHFHFCFISPHTNCRNLSWNLVDVANLYSHPLNAFSCILPLSRKGGADGAKCAAITAVDKSATPAHPADAGASAGLAGSRADN